MLHKYACVALLLTAAPAALAQTTGSVGIGTTIPHAKAALDVSATGKGLLIPRMDSAARAGISSPPDGLMVFQIDGRQGFWYAMSNTWLYIPDKARSGDNLGSHTATQPLKLNGQPLTNNGTGGLRIDNAGQVGVGSATVPTAPLHVSTAATMPGAAPAYTGTFGPNRAGAAVVSVSSQYSNVYGPTRLNDGQTTYSWSSSFGQPMPQWAQYDFGATPITVRQYRLNSTSDTRFGAKDWDLQGSADASTWTTLHTVTGAPAAEGWATCTVPTNQTAYRYYRLLVRKNQYEPQSMVSITEWEVYEENQTIPSAVALRVGPGALALESGSPVRSFSADGTMAAGADDVVPTQQAVKTYVNARVAATPGDNLGNHTATQALNLGAHQLVGGGTTGLAIDNTGRVGLGTTTPTQKLDVRGNLRLGDDGGNVAGTGQAIEWVGPGVSTDPVGIYRVNPAADQSELRVVVGDVADPNDKFVVGRMDGTSAEGGIPGGTFTPAFSVSSAGQVTTAALAGTGTRALGVAADGTLTTASVPGDNLGNHTATQALNLAGQKLVGGTAAAPGTNGLGVDAAGNAQLAATSAYTYAAPKTYTITYGAADFHPERFSGNDVGSDLKIFTNSNNGSTSETIYVTPAARAAVHLPQGAVLVSVTAIHNNTTGGTVALRVAQPGVYPAMPAPTTLGSQTVNSTGNFATTSTFTLPAGTVVDNTNAYYLRLTTGYYSLVRITYTIGQVE